MVGELTTADVGGKVDILQLKKRKQEKHPEKWALTKSSFPENISSWNL